MRCLLWAIGLPIMLALAGLAFDNPNGTPMAVSKIMINQVYAVADQITPQKRRRLGTGFWIDKHHLITNCHVAGQYARQNREDGGLKVTYSQPFAVNFDGTKIFKMEIIDCNIDTDLALLRSFLPNHDAVKLKIDWRKPVFGEALYSAGYGENLPLSPKYGYAGPMTFYLNITMPIASGDSGSPVFDKWGRVRGVVNRAFMVPTIRGNGVPVADKSLAIPGFVLNLFLEENNL